MAASDDKVIPVKVALRIRPISTKESREGCQTALELVENEPQVLIANSNKSWTYDHAYDGDTEQVQVYSEAVKPILEKIFKGYNVTVLAYGQTGSGKTYTMGTAYTSSVDREVEGVIPRVVRDIFNHIQTNKSTEFIVKASFIELYNEQLFDLLSQKPRREDTIVDIREDVKGIKIPGLTELPVQSLESTMTVIERASSGRVTAATAMNLTSSRSHAIFTLCVESRPSSGEGSPTMSKFHMVDLAGSERQAKTKAKGVRLKEGININMGLLALGNVISALGDESKSGQGQHIPYRDSKLTRLLQDSLGGNSHTLMIACVSPADSNIDETISTLRYADRARKIKNKPIANKEANELGRLRAQIQQLQLQLLQGQGVNNANTNSAEMEVMKEHMERLEAENSQLTSALQSAMEDSAHMSEKLLLSEQAQDTLRVKLAELSAHTEQAVKDLGDLPMDKRELVAKLSDKVESVRDQQKLCEKTMLEHDMSRFNPSSRNVSLNGTAEGDIKNDESIDADNQEGGDDEAGDTDNLGGATQALRQNHLATQLAELNKMLISKQELAAKMGVNDEKFVQMKAQYEEQLKSMEEEMVKLQQEKDHLTQQQRNAGNGAASLTGGNHNKISEQRRKRIQELETQIQGLKKQQLEKMRLAKLNQQNEEKVKKLGDEIRGMKVAKVRLIKQMKEESERVRAWKQTKEKELNQLKQKDRRAQVQMAKMERLHERQKNVLKRKMEETMAANKRLKDAMEKKKDARKIKGENNQMAGSGDRVRNWISSELDVVVSEKEAHTAKENLIKDRKDMNQELQKLKQSRRKTLTDQERKDIDTRVTELQQEVDLRNAQISELQQQILSFNEDKEKDKTGDRWSQLNSMVEARIAAQYLFDTATDLQAKSVAKTSEIKDLRSSLDELSSIRQELQDKLQELKVYHQDEIIRMEREHEEKVLFLLRQISGGDNGGSSSADVSLDKDIGQLEERLKFQQKEIDRMSSIHDKLLETEKEVEDLRRQVNNQARAKPMLPNPTLNIQTPPKKPATKKKVKLAEEEERYNEEEFFTSSSEESEDDSDSDQEWRATPLFKRIRNERQSMAGGPMPRNLTVKLDAKRKRRSSNFKEAHEIPDIQEETDDGQAVRKKRSTGLGCTCKSGCKNRKCSCKKEGPYCTILCKCPPNKCANREVPGADVSDASCVSNMETSDVENTQELLDSTFDVGPSVVAKSAVPPSVKVLCPETPVTPTRSPLKARNSAEIFAVDSDVEATPTNPRTQATFFRSPILE